MSKNILLKKDVSGIYIDFYLLLNYYGIVVDLVVGLEVVSGFIYDVIKNILIGVIVLLLFGVVYVFGFINVENVVIGVFIVIVSFVIVDNVVYIKVIFNNTRFLNSVSFRVLGFFGDKNFEVMYVYCDISDYIMVGVKLVKVV